MEEYGESGICQKQTHMRSLTHWNLAVIKTFTEEELVPAQSERVPEEGHRLEVHVRVLPNSLTRARPVKVPHRTV